MFQPKKIQCSLIIKVVHSHWIKAAEKRINNKIDGKNARPAIISVENVNENDQKRAAPPKNSINILERIGKKAEKWSTHAPWPWKWRQTGTNHIRAIKKKVSSFKWIQMADCYLGPGLAFLFLSARFLSIWKWPSKWISAMDQSGRRKLRETRRRSTKCAYI